MTLPLDAWAAALADTATAAARAIMEIYNGPFTVEAKADQSPVTVADRKAESIVLAGLAKLSPRFPVVAEEQVAAEGLPKFDGNTFWLVDALDGTREFVKRGGDFTVNIGLIHEGVPVLGIVQAPARDELFIGITGVGAKVYRNGAWSPIAARTRPARVTVAHSRSHEVKDKFDAFVARYDVAETLTVGSSLKFCLVAEGKADLYPRFGPTSEWDTAAGDAVVRAAGGSVTTFDSRPLTYKKPDFRNGPFLVAGAP